VTIHPIVICGDPVLHRPTTPVTVFGGALAEFIDDLFETNSAANGAGLAANQVGEGCLSVPGENFPTGRAHWTKVTGVDARGEPVEVEGTGFFARCLQHETDHLNGVLYLDRLVGRHARAAKKMVKANGWSAAGNSWLPGWDDDPFGH